MFRLANHSVQLARQPAVFLSYNKSAPAASHNQPNKANLFNIYETDICQD